MSRAYSSCKKLSGMSVFASMFRVRSVTTRSASSSSPRACFSSASIASRFALVCCVIESCAHPVMSQLVAELEDVGHLVTKTQSPPCSPRSRLTARTLVPSVSRKS